MGIVVISSRHFGKMPTRKHLSVLALAVMCGCLGWPGETPARQNSVSGSLSAGPDYDSNVFKSDANREDEWKSQFAPQLSFSSKGTKDNLSLTYAPQFTYNHRREDDEMAQALSFMADKEISSRWKVAMSGNYSSYDNLYFEPLIGLGPLGTTQNFLRADAATQAEIVRILFPELAWNPATDMAFVISQLQQRYSTASPAAQGQIDSLLTQGADGARQRYWTSELGMTSTYEFAESSAITLGYRFASQDNETSVLADHLEQTPSLLVTYQFNPQWRGEVGYEMRATTYDAAGSTTRDTAEDSTANNPHLRIDYQISPANLLFWSYSHQRITFDGELGDTTNQDNRLGWRHGLDQRTVLTTTLGASQLSREPSADERAYSLNLGLSRTFDRGIIAVSGTGLTAMSNTAGSWDKSRQSWELGGNFAYQLMKDLSSTGRFSYGQWDSWPVDLGSSNVDLDSRYDRLQLGGGLSYGFKRWFTLSLNYDYNLFDTENSIILDNYAEHLIMIRLAATKELRRW